MPWPETDRADRAIPRNERTEMYKVKVFGYTEDGDPAGGVFTLEADGPGEAYGLGIEAGWDCGWHNVTAVVMTPLMQDEAVQS